MWSSVAPRIITNDFARSYVNLKICQESRSPRVFRATRRPFPPGQLETLAFTPEKPSIFTFLTTFLEISVYIHIYKKKEKANLIKSRYETRYIVVRETNSRNLSFIETKGMANKSWKMESVRSRGPYIGSNKR